MENLCSQGLTLGDLLQVPTLIHPSGCSLLGFWHPFGAFVLQEPEHTLLGRFGEARMSPLKDAPHHITEHICDVKVPSTLSVGLVVATDDLWVAVVRSSSSKS